MLKLLSSLTIVTALLFTGCAKQKVQTLVFQQVKVINGVDEEESLAQDMKLAIKELDDFKFEVNKTLRVEPKKIEVVYKLNSYDSFINEQTRK